MRLLFKLLLGLVVLCAIGLGTLFYAMKDMPFGPGHLDFSVALPHGYSLYRSSSHQIFVWSDKVEWRDDSVIHEEVVPAKVTRLDFNDTWLIAEQQHLRRRSPNDPGDTYEEPAPGQFSYWIVNLAQDMRHGPLAEAEFNAKRQELHVPDTLQLHDVYDYRP